MNIVVLIVLFLCFDDLQCIAGYCLVSNALQPRGSVLHQFFLRVSVCSCYPISMLLLPW